MNKTRRKAIDDILAKLEELAPRVEDLASEEREAFDAMPESLQSGDRGQSSEAAADELEDAFASLEEAVVYLRNASEA